MQLFRTSRSSASVTKSVLAISLCIIVFWPEAKVDRRLLSLSFRTTQFAENAEGRRSLVLGAVGMRLQNGAQRVGRLPASDGHHRKDSAEHAAIRVLGLTRRLTHSGKKGSVPECHCIFAGKLSGPWRCLLEAICMVCCLRNPLSTAAVNARTM